MTEQRNGVDVVRLRNYIPAKQSAARRAAYDATFALHAIGSLTRRGFDIVIGVVPSLADGVLARLASRLHRIPIGLIVQDLTAAGAQQSGIPGGTQLAGVASGIERWTLTGANRIAVVSEAFIPYLTTLGIERDRIRETRNWARTPKPCRPPEVVRSELHWAPDDTIVLHAGNIGLKQALEHVIDAARLATVSHPTLRFVFMGDGSQRSKLQAEAQGLGNVSFLGPRYGQEYADVLRAADVLLVNERSTVVDMSLPSKLTSYFVAGRPVIASVVAGGATAREVERSGGGIVVDARDPTSLNEAALHLRCNPELSNRLSEAGEIYATRYLGEHVALRAVEQFVLDLVQDANTPGPAERPKTQLPRADLVPLCTESLARRGVTH